MTLKQRAAQATLILRFPVSVYHLRQLYKKQGIKKKKVITNKQGSSYNQDSIKNLTDLAHQEVKQAQLEGYDIFFVDETFFQGQDYIKTAWSKKRTNLKIPEIQRDRKKVGVIGSINSNTGEMIVHLNDGSFFNSDGTIDLVKDIIEENKDKKIALFWDNASIHKSIKTRSFLINNNIKSILNVPYKPDYNAIENVWAEAKKEFRKQLTIKKINNEEIKLYDIVGQSLESVHPDKIYNMSKRSFDLLENEATKTNA